MSSRKKVKARRDAEAQKTVMLDDYTKYPIGSAMRAALEQLKRSGGIIKLRHKGFFDGKGIDFSCFISCLHILADPTHKENRWSCLVDMVKYDDEIYLRLVPSIPLAVKEKWEATGRPPRQMATNDVQLMIAEILGRPDGVSPANIPVAAVAGNPYPPGTRFHEVFNLASDWLAPSELLNRISSLPGVRRKQASALMHLIGKPLKNGQRSSMVENIEHGTRVVRVVRI